MGEAIPLGQAIKATKNLCPSCTETPYRDMYRDNPRGTPGGGPWGIILQQPRTRLKQPSIARPGNSKALVNGSAWLRGA